MLRSIVRAAAFLSVLVVPTVALAEDLGAAGSIYLTAERMFGVSFNSLKTEGDGTDTRSNTDVGFLWSGAHSPEAPSPYTIPRVGFDFAIIQNLTIGGTVGIASTSQSEKIERNGTSVTQDKDTITSFLFAPRVGYVIGFNDQMGLWLRGGFSYFSLSDKSPEVNGRKTTNSISGFALSLDPVFVVMPVDHFGVFAGIMVDVPLSGTSKSEQTTNGNTTTVSVDAKATNVGLNIGLIGHF